MKRWAKELALLGVTLVFIAGAFAGYFYAGLASHIDALPVPGVSTGDTVKVVAREPGVSYNVTAFLKDPATSVGKMIMTDAPAGGTRYVAVRGTEQVNWADSPVGQNPSAKHYWITATVEHKSEDVEITKEAATLFKGKAK